MESYQDIVNRLGDTLEDIDSTLGQSLAQVANKYRQAAEAICKAIIVGHGTEPTGPLEQLIATASKFVEKAESSRDAGIFKAEIRYLQSIGNVFSHDGASSNLSDQEDQKGALDALIKVLRITFFGQSELNAPLLPESMEHQIPARMLGRAKFENPRAEEVVKLCFPKHYIETKIKRSDHDNRLVYDYIVADLGGGLQKGMLFIRSRTAIEKTLNDFLNSIGTDFPDALEIITPRAYRTDGGEIDRQKSILDIIKAISFDSKGRKVQVKYFDDFVWDSCLPNELRADNKTPFKQTSHFIAQALQPLDKFGAPLPEHPNVSGYIEKILKGSHEYNPIHIIIGPAGIGKTTFCDGVAAHINLQERKRVILLSATDFRDISNSLPIESVSDLYRLAADNGLMDDTNSIESHNFEINLACGNFVLLIDGFDELESHLGASLNFNKFMRSLSDLEECFQKVLVILTVRDYEFERFLRFRQASIFRLRGFSTRETERYLSSRLPIEIIGEARKLLRAFNEGGEPEKTTTIPLYVSLICDYLIEYKSSAEIPSNGPSESAKFFAGDQPLDTLMRKIVDREIAKQSLGNIDPDDFFDILIEIIRAPQHTITKDALLGYIKACEQDAGSINPTNFLRNPFLLWGKETVSFKYDSLTFFFKSRLLAQKIKEGIFSASPSIDFMAEFYHGEGPLYDEFKSVLPSSIYADTPTALNWFRDLCQHSEKDIDSELPWRKAMSAFMYWALESGTDRSERTQMLSRLFTSDTWRNFSVFGQFYPLNLNDVVVNNGHVENYTDLYNCDYKKDRAVFHSTYVSFDDRLLPEKLERLLFADDCTFSPNLVTSFQAKERADESGRDIIVSNLYKILKVGFRANRFSWKSKDVYKNVTVIGKFSLDAYLTVLTQRGVLILELSRPASEPGYVVSDPWNLDTRKLIEERNLTHRMNTLVLALSSGTP
ncbi:NACHT domain-containing protein [Herbaspirillum seropedicae]|uniref:NACHT domain-containing protein n=1 Tax=Herbaspirillum seropedicae TaxID=964 RepID=UPI003F8D860F